MYTRIERIKILQLTILILLIVSTGCKKFVQIDPPSTQITAATIFKNDASAAAVMTGIYSNMLASSSGLSSGSNSISELQALAADELTNYSQGNLLYSQFYENALTSSSSGGSNGYYWPEIYNEIHVANAVIEGLNSSSAVTASMKGQLDGEAKFMRAFFHFYAVNLYGDVPLVTTTNYLVNNSIGRTPVAQVYQKIIQDLKDAKSELSGNYRDAHGATTSDKIRPNRGAAEALLARIYLYTGKWDSAEAEATAIINNTGNYQLSTDLNQVFINASTEAIWQLMPVASGYNTYDAQYFILKSPPGSGAYSVTLSDGLVGVFEAGDKRFTNWVGVYSDNGTNYYYPFKYKNGDYDPSAPVTEYVMVFRLAEQYLIRAEARAQQGNIAGAQSDLNVVRIRAGLSNTTAGDQASLITAILHERQVELFTEWGHRWLDMKRTNTINAVMSVVTPQKGGAWDPKWALMPLPLGDLQIDPNLLQNPGY